MTDVAITTGGKDRLSKAVDTLAPEFVDDPVITWLLHDLSPKRRDSFYRSLFVSLLKAAALNSASFCEARDWGSCLVLMHPGERVDNPWTWVPAGLPAALWNLGVSGCRRVLFEYPGATEKVKKRALKGTKKFYYVFFVATRSDSRGQGLCSALVRYCQNLAETEKCPIWLEATTAKSRDVYKKEGFEITEELVLGKGKVDADGKLKKGGEGVTIWGMIWRPKTASAVVQSTNGEAT